jgi:hypothetical protein
MGVATVAALATLPLPLLLTQVPAGTSADALARTREQARLQVASREADTHTYELGPELHADLGLGALPEPSPGICSSTSGATRSTTTSRRP